MLSRIFDLVNRVYRTSPVPDTRNDDGILIVNERMAFACRVTENKEGYFNLFIFDLLTGDELQQNHYQSFPNVNVALVEAHRIVNRIYPTRSVPDAGNDDGILIVNERLAFACRVIEDKEGYFNLSNFDVLTGAELRQNQYKSFPNVNIALVEAHKIVLFGLLASTKALYM